VEVAFGTSQLLIGPLVCLDRLCASKKPSELNMIPSSPNKKGNCGVIFGEEVARNRDQNRYDWGRTRAGASTGSNLQSWSSSKFLLTNV
jgi:hypothetical protein